MNLALDYTGANLVFVVGCPRSGTTWIQRLLATHPMVRTGQESDVFDLYIGPQLRAWERELDPSSSGRGGVGLACYFQDVEFRRVLKAYLLQLLEPMVGALQPGELFLEKTPSHVMFIPEIRAMLAEARFIHVLRDARDFGAGHFQADFLPQLFGQVAHHARELAEQVADRLHARADDRVLQGGSHGVEALHSSGPDVVRNLADWLGVEWSDAEIRSAFERNSADAARAGRATPIPLGGEVARSMGAVVTEPKGFIRRAHAGSWQDDLSPMDKLTVWHVARRTMAEVGYPWAAPWSP